MSLRNPIRRLTDSAYGRFTFNIIQKALTLWKTWLDKKEFLLIEEFILKMLFIDSFKPKNTASILEKIRGTLSTSFQVQKSDVIQRKRCPFSSHLRHD